MTARESSRCEGQRHTSTICGAKREVVAQSGIGALALRVRSKSSNPLAVQERILVSRTVPTLAKLDRGLCSERLDRLRVAMARDAVEVVICTGLENIQYATGYRSSPGSHRRAARMAAFVSSDAVRLVGPCGEAAAALDSGLSPSEYVPYGTFFFGSSDGSHPPATWSGVHKSLETALAATAREIVAGRRSVVDESDLTAGMRQALNTASPSELLAGSSWLHLVRSRKLAGEVDRLRVAARAAEDGITRAMEILAPGVSERELAAVVAGVMTERGAIPRFVVVTVGERSAYSDVFPTDTQARAGDLVRFDVGCTFDGYSSDVGRQAVLGEPTRKQEALYDAILEGESAQLAAAGPGVAARQLFEIAITNVESRGLLPYRRNHCGHGIGMDTYEGFAVGADEVHVLEPGNVLCLETPYYELGWGGMMVEDTILITETGTERLTISDRQMSIVPIR